MRYLFPAVIPVAAIIGWIIVTVVRVMSRTRIRELEIRERIAMIERGLAPPPERDPSQFDRSMGRHDGGWVPGRHRRAGIILMGVGFGLMVLISFTDEVRNGVGVGGFLAILGLAFFISSAVDRSVGLPEPRPRPPVPPESSNLLAPLPPPAAGTDGRDG